MNSGSLYPLTVLFAFLPALLAWALNVVAVYVSAGVGVYALLRWMRLRPSAAFFAAIIYTYSGAMLGQIVHLAVVQGFALLPWMVLVQLHLSRVLQTTTRGASRRARWLPALPSVAGLGVIWGLTFLTGEPRSIAELELLALIVLGTEMVLHNGTVQASWMGRLRVLIANGIGDTVRISYASDHIDEVKDAFEMLYCLGKRERKGIDLIAFDASGLIVDFEVMVRPLNGLQALGAEMGQRLAAYLPAYKAAQRG